MPKERGKERRLAAILAVNVGRLPASTRPMTPSKNMTAKTMHFMAHLQGCFCTMMEGGWLSKSVLVARCNLWIKFQTADRKVTISLDLTETWVKLNVLT